MQNSLLIALIAVLLCPLGAPAVELEFMAQTAIPGELEMDGLRVGGLSALAYDPGCDLYYAVSDDRGEPRFYTLRISLDGTTVAAEILGSTLLRDVTGAPYAGGTLDLEAMALAPDGTLYLATEGVPHRGVDPMVATFRLEGSITSVIGLPEAYLPDGSGSVGVRDNYGFEGMSLSPSGRRLVVATENALLQDGPAADLEHGSPSRILVFDLDSGIPTAEYRYQVEPVPDPPRPTAAFSTNGISEILAVDADRLLVLERSFSAGVGNRARLYLVHLGESPELDKQLVADLDSLGVDPDNVEGMALGPALPDGRRVLVIVADNNFQPSVQTSQVLVFAASGVHAPTPSIPSASVAQIQGAGHFSPLVGRCVQKAEGVVTAILGQRSGQAFWIQDVQGDRDPRTSEGVLVTALDPQPEVKVGDLVSIGGRVEERSWRMELPVTRIVASDLEILERGRELPPPVVLGEHGLTIPGGEVADQRLRTFDPSRFAADAFETVEGMLVRIDDAIVVGPASRYGEIVVVADEGRGSAPRTARGGLRLTPDNVHPYRVVINDRLVSDPPDLTVGDRLDDSVDGVLHYTYGSYKLLNTTALPSVTSADLEGDVSRIRGNDSTYTVASFNLENLWAGSEPAKFERLAAIISHSLFSPDILAVQEIQDDSGPTDDGTVSARATLERLVDAVEAAGGVRYEWRTVDPADNTGGGQPGANIRNAFLFNPERVQFVDRHGCNAERLAVLAGGPTLDCSPSLLDPTNRAFAPDESGRGGSRKPLVGEFLIDGERFVLINLHLASKGGDDPIFGRRQPRVTGSTTRRTSQAEVVAGWVQRALSLDSEMRIVVLGDLNDFENTQPLRVLESVGLEDLVLRLPAEDRYSYVYLGNSQVLDHVLVSPALAEKVEFDAVHVNSEYPAATRASDHDPVVVSLEY